MDKKWIGDMIMLCDAIMDRLDYAEWFNMPPEEKENWCRKFALEHARLIEPYESILGGYKVNKMVVYGKFYFKYGLTIEDVIDTSNEDISVEEVNEIVEQIKEHLNNSFRKDEYFVVTFNDTIIRGDELVAACISVHE